jgi:hypothetical protein
MRMRRRSSSDPTLPAQRPQRQPAHDLYGLQGKLADPSACPRCGAAYVEGRWSWKPAPLEAARVDCPACRRIADGYPAGIVTIAGEFARAHRAEIESRLRHVEESERNEHPLKRIMAIEADGGDLRVTTTDARLARSFGSALRRAFHGKLEQPRPDDQGPARIRWTRD